jgi:hypothetical protein
VRRADAAPACDLTALGTARSRHRRLLVELLSEALASGETRRGWRLELPATGRTLRMAAAWVALERRCCPFAGFRLTWSRRGRVFLDVETGPAGQEALREGMRLALDASATKAAPLPHA